MYLQQQNYPTDQIYIIQTRSAHFRTYGFSDYYLNKVFFNTSDAGKNHENLRSRLIDEKGFAIRRNSSPINPNSLFELIRNSNITFKSSIDSEEINSGLLMKDCHSTKIKVRYTEQITMTGKASEEDGWPI